MERTILGLKKRDHIEIRDIKQKLIRSIQILKYIKWQKWRWAGHVARLNDDRWTYKTTSRFFAYLERKKGQQFIR